MVQYLPSTIVHVEEEWSLPHTALIERLPTAVSVEEESQCSSLQPVNNNITMHSVTCVHTCRVTCIHGTYTYHLYLYKKCLKWKVRIHNTTQYMNKTVLKMFMKERSIYCYLMHLLFSPLYPALRYFMMLPYISLNISRSSLSPNIIYDCQCEEIHTHTCNIIYVHVCKCVCTHGCLP